MRLRLAPVFLLISGLLLAPQGLLASDCICVKYPMYPYAGGNWLHYAVRTSGNCVVGDPLSQIQPYTATAEVCASETSCGTCSGFGNTSDVATVASSHVYTRVQPNYADLDAKNKIKAFLKSNTELTGGDLALAQGQLNGMQFESPDGTNVKPPVVKISRKSSSGTSSEFCAVLWKMRTGGSAWAYLGIEIGDVPDPAVVTTWTSTEVYRGVVMARIGPDEELKQPVIVRGLLELKANGNGYMVRLFNTAANKLPGAYAMRPTIDFAMLTTQSVGSESGVAAANQVTCYPNGVQMPANQCRTVWRTSRRRCR